MKSEGEKEVLMMYIDWETEGGNWKNGTWI